MISMIALVLLADSHVLSADQQVITDDGREVVIKENGTWEFRSTDRFANTKDGLRVRLKEDGSWQYVGNAPMTSNRQVRTTELDITLQNVVVETYEKKVQKNTRVKSQTVIHFELELSPLSKSHINIDKNDISLINVTDNKNRSYPVISIQPVPTILKPGSNTSVTLRTDGAPQWWKNVKSIAITFKPGIFGLQDPVTLTQKVDDIDKKNVDGFEKDE